MKLNRKALQLTLTVVFILIGVFLTHYLISTKKAVKKKVPREMVIPVKAQEVLLQKSTFQVIGDGEVSPADIVFLVPQVPGKVVYVSGSLKKGGLVRKGQVLLKIDPRDYQIRLTQAEAELKKAEAELAQVRADREAALREWKIVNPTETPPPLVAREPQLLAAEAAVQAARAAVERARLDLERTVIKAPFDGVVLEDNVDTGQYVLTGQSLGRIGSVEKAQIRVYVSEQDTQWLKIPGFNTKTPIGTEATVQARIGNSTMQWKGYITRAEPLDTKTRRVPVVVEVRRPYRTTPPLLFGLYVKVAFQGPEIPEGAYISKRAIQWDENLRPFVWVVQPDGRTRKTQIKIVQEYEKTVLVSEGLTSGQLVILDPPTVLTEGTLVKVIDKQ